MRLYINEIENDETTGQLICKFTKYLQGSHWWSNREMAEYALDILSNGIVVKTPFAKRECTDFRIERRSKNKFAISCSYPFPA